MPRDYVINGEALVLSKFGAHIGPEFSNRPAALSNLSELGLASEGIRITPNLRHTDLRVDDFGPEIPADVLAQLADVTISMTLIHYDKSTLDFCLSESMGGTLVGSTPGLFNFAGILPPAGTPLGGYVPYLMSGYHFVSLSILSPQENYPHHFPAAYLTGPAAVMPLGTEASAVQLTWRAIPYVVPLVAADTQEEPESEDDEDFPDRSDTQLLAGTVNFAGEISSSGAVLWNHLPDVV